MPLSRKSFDSFFGSVISESSSVLHSVFVRLYAKPRFGGAGGTAAFGFESLLSGAETETAAFRTSHDIFFGKFTFLDNL